MAQQESLLYVAKRVYGAIEVRGFSRFWKYRGVRLFAFTAVSGWEANRGNGTERVQRMADPL